MIQWNLSGGIVHRDLLLPFIDAFEVPDISFSVHDGFSGLSWSGGREYGSRLDLGLLDELVEQYRQRNVGFNLLFSNHLLRAEDLTNELGNRLLDKFHDERNGVVLCDGLLADYVRERYPKYRLIRSVINAYLDEVIYLRPSAIVSYFQEQLRHYDRVVVPSELNERFDILDQLDKGKLEFLVNNNCFWHCPYATQHYAQIARGYKLTGGSRTRVCLAKAAARGPEGDRMIQHMHRYAGILDEAGKPIKKLKLGQSITLKKSWMKPEQVAQMQRKGCVHFKLQGRDVPTKDFEQVLRTMVVAQDPIHR